MRGVLRGVGILIVLVLLATALILTTGRLLEPSGTQWVRAQAFTPYAMPLYALLVVIALLGLLRSRGLRRVLAGSIALVSVAGLGAHVAWFLPQVSGDQPPAAQGAPVVTVMTVNQQAGSADPVALVRAARQSGTDLLVVQEMTTGALQRLEEAGLGELFQHRAGESFAGEYGTVVFSRHELGEGVPLEGSVGGLAVPVRLAGQELTVLAAHASPPGATQGWRAQHRLIAAWAADRQPDLILGDLNATADHRPLRVLADQGYRSVTELANEGWRPTWPADRRLLGLVAVPPLVQIDHVLCGSGMTAVSSRTVEIVGSDHRGVVARVAVR